MGKNFQNLLRNPFSFMREISISTKLLKYHPEKLMEPKSFLIHFYSQKQERKCLYIFYRKWSLSWYFFFHLTTWYCHKWFLLFWEKLEWQNTAKYRHPFWNVNFCCHLNKHWQCLFLIFDRRLEINDARGSSNGKTIIFFKGYFLQFHFFP